MSKFSRTVAYHKRKVAKDPKRGSAILKRNPQYVGDPQHKRNPGDFGLTPPAAPHTQKTLCDSVGIFSRKVAQDLLCAGLDKGLLSEQCRNQWPCNIWAVSEKNEVLEARLDTDQGTYHGFPMLSQTLYMKRSCPIGGLMHKNLFAIHADWLSGQMGLLPHERLARISVALDGVPLTHNFNLHENTYADFFIAAPYPLAVWFLDNWWRLCYEPTPDQPTTDWRMSHMLSAAGYGYSWPAIGFQSDMHNITVTSLSTPSRDVGSARFTNAYTSTVPLDTVLVAISTFVEDCLKNACDKDLEDLYTTLQHERADQEVTLYRKIEAQLGFDWGDGDEEKITDLLKKAEVYGDQTVCEVAPFLTTNPRLKEEMEAVRTGTTGCKIDTSSLDVEALQLDWTAKPWDVGFSLAKQVRNLLNLNGPVTNEALCEAVSLQKAELQCTDRDDAVGLGACVGDGLYALKFGKRSHTATRFIFTRGICDAILSRRGHNNFLAMTPCKTFRQKVQRAFAAELLCPIGDIMNETDNVNDKDAIDYVAEKYEVNTRLVESQLANHGYGQLADERNLWLPDRELKAACA